MHPNKGGKLFKESRRGPLRGRLVRLRATP